MVLIERVSLCTAYIRNATLIDNLHWSVVILDLLPGHTRTVKLISKQ